jgi:acetyl esterase/lipase
LFDMMTSRVRGPLLITAVIMLVGAVLMPVVALPALWGMSVGYGVLCTLLAAGQLGALATVLLRPTRRAAVVAALGSVGLLVVWVLDRVFAVLPAPDPWEPVDTTFGLTDWVFAVLQFVGLVLLVVRASWSGQRARARGWVAGGLALLVVVPVAAAGITFAVGQPSSLVYCRTAGIPLGMDIYQPARRSGRAAPVAVYVHGGGFMLGSGASGGVGALLANSAGALFEPLRQRLNASGYLVASVDYRLAPAAAWPAPLDDAECAIRYLRTNATALGIDPHRIAVWGSSAGGTIVSLLGTVPGLVDAVVNMFGPADLSRFAGASSFMRTTLSLSLGSDPAVLRAASPRDHVRAGLPPFLILHGTEDPLIGQSVAFAAQLRAAGDSATFVAVRGTGHQLDTPGQQPSADQLVDMITAFLARV